MGLDFRMKGLTGLVLQSKHCHTTRCFFFVFSRALLAAFGGGAGLILISLQPFFDGVWARWTPAREGVEMKWWVNSTILASLPSARL